MWLHPHIRKCDIWITSTPVGTGSIYTGLLCHEVNFHLMDPNMIQKLVNNLFTLNAMRQVLIAELDKI